MKVIPKLLRFSLLLTLTFVLHASCDAQTVLLERHTDRDTVQPTFGPNLKHYVHFYLGMGFIVGPSDADMPIKYGNSLELNAGWRYKYRLNQRFAVGADLGIRWQWFTLKQDSAKILPTPQHFKRETFTPGFVDLNPFVRINVDKLRGNSLGKYLDLGVGVSLTLQKRYVQVDNEPHSVRVNTTRTKLDWFAPFQSVAFARFGFNWLIIYANYRLTPFFREDKMKSYFGGAAQLPALSVGLQVKI